MDNLVMSEFRALLQTARLIADEFGDLLESTLRTGLDEPLPREEAIELLTSTVRELQRRAIVRGDDEGNERLQEGLEALVSEVLAARDRIASPKPGPTNRTRAKLETHDGIVPHPVKPTPVFHERPVPVVEGFVRTSDIVLWDQNERLDIHLAQFQRAQGRNPSETELLDIMLGRSDLPGISSADQFEIKQLARSIAVNGVRTPPIIDVDGTLLDGNRRVTACHYILSDDEFGPEEKRRAERIVVWQLTEHATDVDRESVIVSLNFEDDCKQKWPEYVKARKVYNEWETMLIREPRAGRKRVLELKRELARKFALGSDTSKVTRYIGMIEIANEFEDHHINIRNKDRYEVMHRASEHFQYFEELGKGSKPGGVNFALNQDSTFKALVYDLLYCGKFNNWREIRALKLVAGNQEAMDHLRKAREEKDIDEAQDIVEQAVGIVTTKNANQRQIGANTRIEVFVSWLEELPVRAFRVGEPAAISVRNLNRLHGALQLVSAYLEPDESEPGDLSVA